jgi:hypothetical protein
MVAIVKLNRIPPRRLVTHCALACLSVILITACSQLEVSGSAVSACTRHLSTPQREASLTVRNDTSGAVLLSWVHPREQTTTSYRLLKPGESFAQPTYVGHYWVASSDSRILGTVCVMEPVARFDIE